MKQYSFDTAISIEAEDDEDALFIFDQIGKIYGVTTYLLAPKVESSIPQSPEFESLGLAIKHSVNGDFFEIYGTYNDTIAGFKQFIDDSFNLPNSLVESSILLSALNLLTAAPVSGPNSPSTPNLSKL